MAVREGAATLRLLDAMTALEDDPGLLRNKLAEGLDVLAGKLAFCIDGTTTVESLASAEYNALVTAQMQLANQYALEHRLNPRMQAYTAVRFALMRLNDKAFPEWAHELEQELAEYDRHSMRSLAGRYDSHEIDLLNFFRVA